MGTPFTPTRIAAVKKAAKIMTVAEIARLAGTTELVIQHILGIKA